MSGVVERCEACNQRRELYHNELWGGGVCDTCDATVTVVFRYGFTQGVKQASAVLNERLFKGLLAEAAERMPLEREDILEALQ